MSKSHSGPSGTKIESPLPDGLSAVPRTVWALGFVSLFMDISSEMIHGLLPVFLVTVIGASALSVGLIEGIAEATASIGKVFSGALSDRLRRRKPLLLLGYGFSALSKPLFPLASSAGWVFTARFLDRVGKGIRVAPRDALVADVTPRARLGAAYGLRQSMDSAGAIAGPLLAIAVMAATNGQFRTVFWIAVIPALLAVAVLAVGVREPARPNRPVAHARSPLRLTELKTLGAPFWGLVAVSAVLMLARFSEAFLILRAENLGLALAMAPLVLVVMNAVYALSAYPIGKISDRLGRTALLAIGFGLLVVADIVLASAAGTVGVLLGAALWGLHLGMTQGLLVALVADAAPESARGTAFGAFHLVTGATALTASILAGWAWTVFGAATVFLAGAGVTLVGLAALAAWSFFGPPAARRR